MPLNSYVRRPIDLTAYRNRRVVRQAPEPKPLPRNEKLISLRSRELDVVVVAFVAAIVLVSTGLGICVDALYVIAPRTPDNLLETLVMLLGMLFLGLGARYTRKALTSWKACNNYDDKLEQQRLALARVIQPSERKPPVLFKEWMQ